MDIADINKGMKPREDNASKREDLKMKAHKEREINFKINRGTFITIGRLRILIAITPKRKSPTIIFEIAIN